MPNETSNVLQMYGDQNTIDQFLKDHFYYGPDHSEEYSQIFWNFEHSVPITDKKYIEANKKLEKEGLECDEHNRLVLIKRKYTKLSWGTSRGIVTYNKNNKIHIETPWMPCDNWFKNMISKYPTLNFSLKYNDEYSEEFYGWAVACHGVLIDSEMICLHPSEENGGINLFKYYNEEKFGYDPDFLSDNDNENDNDNDNEKN